ncbi:chaperone-binding protein [Colletotrichum truncatum]|uniref:Chaperone-binding protein n=1 Tax=Colletotrichum truncatum TaxID=5467 RepID=A0ACC3ZIT0_COLTU
MFGNLDFNPENVPRVKLGLHIVQFVLSFVIWALEIAVFRAKDAKIVGNNGWTFGVCFLSIPAWIYLIMAPRWPRTRKLANPYAMVAVDGVFTVIWLSAFASQAAYNTANQCGEACNLSKAIVGLGVFVTVLFGVSTFVSLYTLKHYQFHGSLPGYDKQKIAGDNIDPDKAAFSMAPHDEEAYAPVNMDDHNDDHPYGSNAGTASNMGSYNDRYGASSAYGPEDDDPNRYGSLPSRQNAAMFDSETDYHSQPPAAAPTTMPYTAPAYDDDRPAQFPAANYDRTLR